MYQLSYETMEVTGPQMVLTMKLTTFAWNVSDGRRPTEVHDYIHTMSVGQLTLSMGLGSG